MKLVNILIVEDNAGDRELLRSFFSQGKFCNRIYYATNALQALQKLSFSRIDLILMDVQLPDMNGIELARKINEKRDKQIPIVCLSGIADMKILQQAEEASVMAFIEKPLNFKLLQELMRKICQLHLGLMWQGEEEKERR